MRFVEPEIFILTQTKIVQEGLDDYLEFIGASDWTTDAPSDVEAVPEIYGRICYRSFKAGLNPNVTKIREGNEVYLDNIIDVAHGSVTEHSIIGFIFVNVSRVFTHELVRHRVGVAISQESLRYVRLDNIPLWMPTVFAQHGEISQKARQLVLQMEEFQRYVTDYFKLDDPSIKFKAKKEITSAMRRFVGDGVATSIGWSANIRTIRHVLELRTSPAAEEEMRLVFGKVGMLMMRRYPNLFSDYEVELIEGYPCFKTQNPKI